jgi:HSP20 family protein
MNRNSPNELPVKLYRTRERLTLAAPLPGLEPQDISVEVSNEGESTELTIEAPLRGAFKGDKEVLSDEWSPGPYYRHIVLPIPVDASLANFTYENGIAVLTLPVAERTVPATLSLERIGGTVGQSIGNAGHPVRPNSSADHNARKAEVEKSRPAFVPSESRQRTHEVSESLARHPEGPGSEVSHFDFRT